MWGQPELEPPPQFTDPASALPKHHQQSYTLTTLPLPIPKETSRALKAAAFYKQNFQWFRLRCDDQQVCFSPRELVTF